MQKEDFTKYVDMALQNSDLAAMRPVVEKELLHYEIFNALDDDGLLKTLVFQGGTSLRLCRGSDRFSEDLDFAGGRDFSAAHMARIKTCIIHRIGERFGLDVTVKEPNPTKRGTVVNVDKWMVSIETTPQTPHTPRQKIKIEIANIPAYTREAVPLRLNYSVLEGMRTVIVNAEKIDEILADKVIALPASIARIDAGTVILTPDRTRHRDIWDMAWLLQRGARLDSHLVKAKIADYGLSSFDLLLENAIATIPTIATGPVFRAQMQRFIKKSAFDRAFGTDGYDATMGAMVSDLLREAKVSLIQEEAEGK